MEAGEKKFDADTLEKALAAVEKTDVTEERDTPRAVIMAMYPRLQEVMTSKGMSVRQLYQALKAQMDLPISEKTFSTYLQAAKKAAEGEKSRRGRKKGTKTTGEAARETTLFNGGRAAAEGSPTLSKPEDSATAGGVPSTNQSDQREEPPAGANGSVEPEDAKAAFEAHEAELDDDMEALAAKFGKKD